MKTQLETSGYGGGFANASEARSGFRAAVPVSGTARHGARPAYAQEDARPELQLRTGASKPLPEMTDDSLAHLPLPLRVAAYAAAIGTLTGIAPLALAGLLGAGMDGLGAVMLALVGPGGMTALAVAAWLAVVAACFVALWRLGR